MIEQLHVDSSSEVPKYRQIENSIVEGVSSGEIEMDQQLPSINQVCASFGLSRDTVVKAYSSLRERGVIASAHGKGYYITGLKAATKKKVFVLFNELNAYKERLHKSLIQGLGEEVEVETFFHNHNIEIFEYLIAKALGKYTQYVVMPTFNGFDDRIEKAIRTIPERKLYLLDRSIGGGNWGSVYQDFKKDAKEGFESLAKGIRKYKKIRVLYSDEFMHPYDSVEGIEEATQGQNLEVYDPRGGIDVVAETLYVTLRDSDLVKLVKNGNERGFVPGKDYGIVSYNDSPMKEIIHGGITVISTDFAEMGSQLAKMILGGRQEQLSNTFRVIRRNLL